MSLKALLNFVFPPLCLHCHKNTGRARKFFCEACSLEFALIPPEGRCRKCFLPYEACTHCREQGYPFTRLAAAIEYQGAPTSFIQHFKYQNKPYLAKDGAALLVLQYLNLNWKMPDLIIPVPQSITRSFSRGYNQSLLLAQEVGKFLNRPVMNVLKRYSGDLPQAALNQPQREALSQSVFSWKKRMDLNEKVVLIIDDVRTTGTTLRHSAALLKEGYPAALYGMTLAAT